MIQLQQQIANIDILQHNTLYNTNQRQLISW